MFDYLADPTKPAISVWVFKSNKHLAFEPMRDVFCFKSHLVYCVIRCRHGVQVMGSSKFTELKVFFWVGHRVQEYDTCFAQIWNDLEMIRAEAEEPIIMQFYVEFQYAESSLFFEQVKQIERPIG